MIITKIIGGMGNQMFQYAMARRLSEHTKSELRLDTSSFIEYKLHKYSLNHLNIPQNIASKEDIEKTKKMNKIFKLINKIETIIGTRPYFKKSIVIENGLTFDRNLLNASGNVYLEGYWQSEKYFKDIRDIILNEFTVKTEPSEKNLKHLEEIRKTNSVAIHVRRADYVNVEINSSIHGTCSKEYYQDCIKYIEDNVKDPHFYIFSDDPDWAEENIKVHGPVVVSYNTADQNYEDLRLMYSCKHFIIANSTFSWWGAWLSQNQNKIVCAPKQWFIDSKLDSRDIVPENWLRF